MRADLRERLPPLARAWTFLGRRDELRFWRRAVDDGRFVGEDHEPFFTTHFGLDRSFYVGKRVLDVGCGPRQRLDWMTMAAARVGLDPLADRYRELLGDEALRGTEYVQGVAERMPFAAGSFDVVTSFNSLDHVDDIECTAAEIKRVLSDGGSLLVITELGHEARLTEPQEFSWEVTRLFEPQLRLVDERRYEDSGQGIDRSVALAVPYDDGAAPHPGVLVSRFVKSGGTVST